MVGSSQTARMTPRWELRIVVLWFVFVRWLWAFLRGDLWVAEFVRAPRERGDGLRRCGPDISGDGWLHVSVVLETWLEGVMWRGAPACALADVGRGTVKRRRPGPDVFLQRSTSCCLPVATWDFPRPVSGWN